MPVIILERDNKTNNRHSGFLGNFNLIKDIKKHNFDKIIIFNSSIRYHLISKFCGIPEIYQYPLFQKSKQHIIDAPKKFLKDKLDLIVNDDPEVQIDDKSILKSIKEFQINKNEMNILLGIGGSGSTKRIPSNIFLSVIEKISKVKKCKFFLATGKNDEEQIILKEILESNFKEVYYDSVIDLLGLEKKDVLKNGITNVEVIPSRVTTKMNSKKVNPCSKKGFLLEDFSR